ncbi:RluA family pseudouridine synthase [Defluviitalea raffinosedens]|uniref:Pseudouridine synthase n=2 Tax=Defluviitalea raffinosedens TaxID=1450156 RepID=A0A7C8HGK8_9FIRM|nr:RluA family pseudouridine synthase [Defluviitalea raffinosedens]HHW67239.1 RluA family pseudouridine synthase [Candidatus Epulonipiscium sp.]
MKEIHITQNDSNQRLDKFLMKYLNQSSKGFIYKMLRKKRIKYNGKKGEGNEKLQIGDIIQLYLADETIDQFRVQKYVRKVNKTFSVIFEDEHILLCNKPLGLLVHPDKNNDKNTLMDEVLSYLVDKGDYNPKKATGFTPAICNRLDRNTSGIIIVGKSLNALQTMNQMIKENKIQKYYLTIVKGVIKTPGVLKGYHKKNIKSNEVEIIDAYEEGSKYVETHYRPIVSNSHYTLLEIQLITGRSHQIRAHLSKINHPIIGDSKYGDNKVNAYFKAKYHLKHQFLHAYKVKFTECPEEFKYLENHSFKAELPYIYREICDKEKLKIDF